MKTTNLWSADSDINRLRKHHIPDTVHQQVKEQIRQLICSVAVGTRLPSERLLAEQYNVCRMTVNKVLKVLVDEGYLSRRVGDGTYVIPRPQPVAQIAANSTSRGEIIIVYPDFYSYTIWKRVNLTEIMTMRQNLRLISVKIHPESDWASVYELIHACSRLKGVIIVAAQPINNELEQLNAINCPVVILGEDTEKRLFDNLYYISRNHVQSGYIKMNTLLAAGHRRIGWIPNEPPTLAGQLTIKGMKAALYRHKLRYKDLTKASTQIDFWENPMHAGYQQTHEVMQACPDLTGLVIDTFPGAIGALRALNELKILCPDQVSLVTAFEDAGLEEYTYPSITTVVEPYETTINLALQIIDNQSQINSHVLTVDVKLVERESVRTLLN